jgi:hypothetical protein
MTIFGAVSIVKPSLANTGLLEVLSGIEPATKLPPWVTEITKGRCPRDTLHSYLFQK